jgi:hypothetical protein
MKNTIKILFVIITTLSCSKRAPIAGDNDSMYLLEGWLIDGPWQLISATNYNAQNKISVYIGQKKDTLTFGYASGTNSNVVLTSISAYINNISSTCSYQLYPTDTSIICKPAWRPNYSDTIFIKSFSDNLLVFEVKNYNQGAINQIEIDTLKKIRFW